MADRVLPPVRVPQLAPGDNLVTACRVARQFADWPRIPLLRGSRLLGALRLADLREEAPAALLPPRSVPAEVLPQQLAAAMLSGRAAAGRRKALARVKPAGGGNLGSAGRGAGG